MKKASAKKTRSAAQKGRVTTADDYAAQVAEPARAIFAQLRAAVRAAAPADAVETISYGIPAFRRGKVLVWFAAFTDHCSLFPTAAIIDEFRGELNGFTISKGTIQFPLGKRLPIGLIRRIVKARVAQVAKPKKR